MSLWRFIGIRIGMMLMLLPSLMMLGEVLGKGIYNTHEKIAYKRTFIEVISTPSYGDNTKKVLEEFNSFADNKIITFKRPFLSLFFSRPVRIYDMPDFYEDMKPEVLGETSADLGGCFIMMKKRQPLIDYRETLIHEYLHCMGYDHVPDPLDLMYYALNPVDKEDNIRQYAKKVYKKYYE